MELHELIRLHDERLGWRAGLAAVPVPGVRERRRRRSLLRLGFVYGFLLVLFAVGCWQLILRMDNAAPAADLLPETRFSQPFMAASGAGLPAAYAQVLQWAD